VEEAVEAMTRDLDACLAGGMDGVVLENMHDFPCVREAEMGPEVAAYMTRLAVAARARTDELSEGARRPPIGIQVLFAANRTALAVAQAAGLDFIRAEAWTHAHISDKGWIDAQGGRVVRYQHAIGASGIRVFVDVKKKHASHALTADLAPGEVAALQELHRADGVIVTGSVTGDAPDASELREIRGQTKLPVLLGSGIDASNLAEFFPLADGFIVGTSLKEGGEWDAPVDKRRVRELAEEARRLR
jgi:hypothetical protein